MDKGMKGAKDKNMERQAPIHKDHRFHPQVNLTPAATTTDSKAMRSRTASRSDYDTNQIPRILYDSIGKVSYQLGRFLGKGGFARCYEVVNSSTKQALACKIVNKGLLTKDCHREKMAQEITIHRDLKHQFIVDFYSYFEDDKNVYIVLELCTRKSLMELQKRRRSITEHEARYFLRQLVLAVLYLHEDRHIIHRDLKLGNIFINDDMELKLGDFGLATFIETEGERKKTLCGTPNYIAPEVLTRRGHSYEVDVWSIGCILYTLLIGEPPFQTSTLGGTYSKIRRGDYNLPANRVSPAARSLIIQMLQIQPSCRPTASQILDHEFFTKNFIPSRLPVSCLITAPRFERNTKPLPQNPGSSVIKRPLAEHNPKSIPSTDVVANPNEEKEECEMSSSEIINLIHQMRTQLVDTLQGGGAIIPVENIDDYSEDPSLCPMLWISKWVDYSDKYGFGYQLSDDSIGVSYNDHTKMILFPDLLHIHYIERNGQEKYYTLQSVPASLQKKVKLLNYFQQYMKDNLIKSTEGSAPPAPNCIPRLPNMWTWFRTSRAVVMILSTGTIQINNFRDHTKMILCPLLGAISTIGGAGRIMRTFKLSALAEHGYSADLGVKLQYALEKCEIVLEMREKQSKQKFVTE